MDFSSINWLAVAVCVLISMISGSLWYNPKTFFPTWWKGIGRKEGDRPGNSNMAVTWGLTVLASLVQAVAMAFVINLCRREIRKHEPAHWRRRGVHAVVRVHCPHLPGKQTLRRPRLQSLGY